MKLSGKLYGAVAVLAFSGAVASVGSMWTSKAIGSELEVAVTKTATKLSLINSLQENAWRTVASLRGAFVFAALNKDQDLENSARDVDVYFKSASDYVLKLRPLINTEAEAKSLDRFESTLKDFEKVADQYKQLCRRHNIKAIAPLSSTVKNFIVVTKEALDLIEDSSNQSLLAQEARAASLETRSFIINIAVMLLLAVAVFAAAVTVRNINKTLTSSVAELTAGAHQVASAARQVSHSSNQLASGSSEQAASLEETSASSEEIAAMARRNSENSSEAAGLVSATQMKIVETNASLEQTVAAMAEINAQSGRISSIIKTIDEIAFQTNILALNAAVEAARAGEAGMGFAVVAGEVRNLAQRCAQAARDTSALIEESIAKSRDGKTKVDSVASAIQQITQDSARIKNLVDEVNQGSLEQARGIEQIGKAMVQMEQVTHQSASSSEQSAAAASQLNAQSEKLKAVIDRLNEMVGAAEETSLPRPLVQTPPPAPEKKPEIKLPAHSPAPVKSVRPAAPKPAPAPTPVATKPKAVHDEFPLDEDDDFKEF